MCTPPAVPILLRKLRQAPDGGLLFDGSDSLFTESLDAARAYGEYGVGASTLHVALHTGLPITAVDSSSAWANYVRARIPKARASVQISHINLGPVADFGYPENHSHRRSYPDYFLAPWSSEHTPDLVLVDGRLRVAAFLTCLMNATPECRILFDDYVERPEYHLVEEFAPLVEHDGRMALFEIPTHLDRSSIAEEITRFSCVWE